MLVVIALSFLVLIHAKKTGTPRFASSGWGQTTQPEGVRRWLSLRPGPPLLVGRWREVLLTLTEVQKSRFGPGAFMKALCTACGGLWAAWVRDGWTPQAISDILVDIHSGGPGLPVKG